MKAVHELRGRVFALHVKDEAEQRAESHNVVIGKGHLDLVGLFKALRETEVPRGWLDLSRIRSQARKIRSKTCANAWNKRNKL